MLALWKMILFIQKDNIVILSIWLHLARGTELIVETGKNWYWAELIGQSATINILLMLPNQLCPYVVTVNLEENIKGLLMSASGTSRLGATGMVWFMGVGSWAKGNDKKGVGRWPRSYAPHGTYRNSVNVVVLGGQQVQA